MQKRETSTKRRIIDEIENIIKLTKAERVSMTIPYHCTGMIHATYKPRTGIVARCQNCTYRYSGHKKRPDGSMTSDLTKRT